MNQVKCVPTKTVELSMITPSLFLNLLTASVCPQMDLRLQAQRGPLLGSPANHRSGLYCVALILGTGTTWHMPPGPVLVFCNRVNSFF